MGHSEGKKFIENNSHIKNRGKPTCGDIDVLLTRRDEKPFEGFLNKLVRG